MVTVLCPLLASVWYVLRSILIPPAAVVVIDTNGAGVVLGLVVLVVLLRLRRAGSVVSTGVG